MAVTIFFTTLFFFSTLVLYRYYEYTRGFICCANVRSALDRFTVLCVHHTKARINQVLKVLHVSVVLKGMHMLIYMLLMAVRFLEKKLTVFARSLRKAGKYAGTPSGKLAHISRKRK